MGRGSDGPVTGTTARLSGSRRIIALLLLLPAAGGAGPGAAVAMLVTAQDPTARSLAAGEEEWSPGLRLQTRDALRTYFERLAQFGFSGSVLAAKGADPFFVAAHGLADREASRPFLPSTVVTIGSITKPLTAAAVLALEDRGLLDVRNPISAFLEEVPADKRGITVHHLLTHTSGLKRNGLEGGDFNLEATRAAVLADALGSKLLSAPGGVYRYSNLGYSLLAMIIEHVSGRPYEEFLQVALLLPARMVRTGYLRPYYAGDELAAGYRDGRRLDPVIRQPMLDDGPTWNLRGNGGLHSDVFDMYRWIMALRHEDVLPDSAIETMIRPHVAQGAPGRSRSYGYGWEIARTSEGTRDISHSGGNGFFAADLHWLPDDDLMFFVATNEAAGVNMRRLSATVRAILLGEDHDLPPRRVAVSPRLLERYEGRYRLADDGVVTVTRRDSVLALTAEGDDAIRLILGGTESRADETVDSLATLSREIVESEFGGDFEPKFAAMGGTIPIEDLRRYHGYDREVWDAEFGALRAVETLAAGGERDEVVVVVRMTFERGSAAQVHTWRNGRLANVSVVADWSEFEFARTVYPISEVDFESFSMSSSLRTGVRFTGDGETLAMTFTRHPEAPVAVRIGPS